MGLIRAPLNRYAGGRLTLTSGTPVTVSDVTGANAATLYYTPYLHNLVSLYTGVAWRAYTFAELSLSLSGYTIAKPYDVWLYDNAGTLTLDSTVWTNTTTRATAISQQDGTWVKSGDSTRLYLGTIYMQATGQTEDSSSNRYVWNMYNRVVRSMHCVDTTNSWTYTTLTWRQANNSATNQVNYVNGLAGDGVVARVHTRVNNASGVVVAAGVGVDSTTTNSAQLGGIAAVGTATNCPAYYSGTPTGVGLHYLARLEISTAAGTTVWFGDYGSAYWLLGLSAEVMA